MYLPFIHGRFATDTQGPLPLSSNPLLLTLGIGIGVGIGMGVGIGVGVGIGTQLMSLRSAVVKATPLLSLPCVYEAVGREGVHDGVGREGVYEVLVR